MVKVIQIGSLFYCAIVNGDDDIKVISGGYSTYEMCRKMTKCHEL